MNRASRIAVVAAVATLVPATPALAGGVIVLLGLVDDKWGIDALTKLAGQVVAAGIMVLLGLQLLTLSLPGFGHRWTRPGDGVDATAEFWKFARMGPG